MDFNFLKAAIQENILSTPLDYIIFKNLRRWRPQLPLILNREK
jgi:hypothetical protein